MEQDLNPRIETLTENLTSPSLAITSGTEFRLWLDYIYDAFGATLEHRWRRYLVSAGLALCVYLIGLGIALPFGLAWLYLSAFGFQVFAFGIAWFMSSLRWLSQTYHVRTNAVRWCFLIPDEEYRRVVAPYAARATNNRIIMLGSALVACFFWADRFGVYYAPATFRTTLLLGFPASLPHAWHSGSDLLPKMVILGIFCTAASLGIYTGAHITLTTLPLYWRFTHLPIIPVPSLVTEMFGGVLRLYRAGAIMWSFGVVLVEIIYSVQADIVAITFALAVSTLGLLAYFIPRMAVVHVVDMARAGAVRIALQRYFDSSGDDDSKTIMEIDHYVRAALRTEEVTLGLNQLAGLLLSQLLPLLPFLATWAPFAHIIP